MIEIQWEHPMVSTLKAYRVLRERLKDHPGEWAVVREFEGEDAMRRAGSFARTCRARGRDGGPWAGFELEAGRREDGSVAVWARYVRGLLHEEAANS